MRNDGSSCDEFTSEGGTASTSSSDLGASRYSLTLNFTRTYKQDDDCQSETFDLGRCESGPSPESLLSEAYPVFNVDVFTVKRNQNVIERFTEDPKGCVCFCDMTTLEDIHAVQRIAATRGAKALVVTEKPTELAQLPVFVLPAALLAKLTRCKCATVTFQRLEVVQPSSSESERTDDVGPMDTTENEALQPYASPAPGQFADATIDKACSTDDGSAEDSALYTNLSLQPAPSAFVCARDGDANRLIDLLDAPAVERAAAGSSSTRVRSAEGVSIPWDSIIELFESPLLPANEFFGISCGRSIAPEN